LKGADICGDYVSSVSEEGNVNVDHC